MRPRHALLVVIVLSVAACDCRSGAERCAEAQRANEEAWGAYVTALDREIETSRQAAADARSALKSVELRLGEEVKREVDQRRNRWDPAWLRAYDAALVIACRKDATCTALREKETAAKLRIEDATPRIEAARRVLAVTRTLPTGAAEAAAAVDADATHPELRPARQAARATAEACEGVTVPMR